jgi:hypothetical protein
MGDRSRSDESTLNHSFAIPVSGRIVKTAWARGFGLWGSSWMGASMDVSEVRHVRVDSFGQAEIRMLLAAGEGYGAEIRRGDPLLDRGA